MAGNYDWTNLTPMGRQLAIGAGGNPNDGYMPSAGAGAVPGYYDNNYGANTSGGQYNFAVNNLTNWSPQQMQNNASAETGSDMFTSPWSRFADSSGNPLAAFKDGNNFRVFKDPGDMGGTGISGQQLGKMAGTNYDVYDPTGKYLSNGTFNAADGWKNENLGDALGVGSIFAMAAGGALAAGAGGAAGAGAAGAGDAAGMAGSGAFLGSEAGASGIGAWDAALANAGAAGAAGTGAALTGVPPPVAPGAGLPAGTAAGTGAGTISIPGVGNVSLSQLGSLGSLVSQLGGGSGGSAGGGASGNLDLGGLLGLIGGGVDASQQGKAAQEMKSWLQGQQSKIDGAYNPGTPEYNQLWDEMSRKDAAAGRNSQYGPRSVELAAKLAALKMNATTQFTTGTSRAYADALNQNASRYAGLSAAGQRALNGTGNNVTNLSSLLRALSTGSTNNLGGGITMNPNGGFAYNPDPSTAGSYGTMSNDDIWNMINGGI